MKKQSGKTTHSAKKTKPVFLWLVFIPAVVVIPLIQSHNTSDPVLTARFLALSITVFVTVLYVIVKNKKEFFPAGFIKLPVFTVFLIYFIWSALSLVWSVNPSEGLFDVTKTFLSLALLIFTVQLFLKYDNAFAFLTKGIIAASFVATTTGLVQYAQNVPGLTGYQQFMALYQVKGLMAHKNQFAVSLFLMIPFVLSGIFVLNRWWRIAGAVSLLLIMLNIVLVQTRSVWMATLVFIFVSGALWIWVEIRNRHPHKKRLLKRMVMVTGLAAVLFVASLIAVQQSGAGALLKNRMASVFNSNSRNNQSRLKIWNATLQMINDRPLTGVGAGNWKIDVIHYYTLEFGSFYKNWRRPHNDMLWVAAEKGIIGLLFYLTVFLLIIFYGFKTIFNTPEKEKRIAALLVTSGVTGYLVISLLTFPLERVNHQIFLMLMFGFLISGYLSVGKKKLQTGSKTSIILATVIFIFSGLAVYYSFMLYRSEYFVKKLFDAQSAKHEYQVITYADKALTPLTTIDSRSLPIPVYSGMANMQLGKPGLAYKDFKLALKYFPDNVGVLSNLALVSVHLKKTGEALDYMNRALYIFPHNDDILYNKAYINYMQHQYKNAYLTLLSHGTDKQKDDYKKLMRAIKRHLDN